MIRVTKKHIKEINPIYGEKYITSYYEFSGKIVYNLPTSEDNFPYYILNHEYTDKNNVVRKMNYISFDLISDDPTVKTIKKICYYSTNEREINQHFSKIKNYSSIKLFLVPINEINHELYYKDNGDYAIYQGSTNHKGSFIFKSNRINNFFYYLQINMHYVFSVLVFPWLISLFLVPIFFHKIEYYSLYSFIIIFLIYYGIWSYEL